MFRFFAAMTALFIVLGGMASLMFLLLAYALIEALSR